jgi:hypothetical protein
MSGVGLYRQIPQGQYYYPENRPFVLHTGAAGMRMFNEALVRQLQDMDEDDQIIRNEPLIWTTQAELEARVWGVPITSMIEEMRPLQDFNNMTIAQIREAVGIYPSGAVSWGRNYNEEVEDDDDQIIRHEKDTTQKNWEKDSSKEWKEEVARRFRETRERRNVALIPGDMEGETSYMFGDPSLPGGGASDDNVPPSSTQRTFPPIQVREMEHSAGEP